MYNQLPSSSRLPKNNICNSILCALCIVEWIYLQFNLKINACPTFKSYNDVFEFNTNAIFSINLNITKNDHFNTHLSFANNLRA